MGSKFRQDLDKDLYRIPLTVTKEMEDWLYNLSKKLRDCGGYKLPKTYILRALIGAIMKLDIDLNNIKDEKELEKRIIDAIKKYK